MEGTPNFNIFLSAVFTGRINLKEVEEPKKGSRVSGGMLPRKIFENSRTVMTILVHFEQISGKLNKLRNFLPLILSASPVSIHGVLQTGFHISRQDNVLFLLD